MERDSPIVSFRRPRNLKDELVRAKLKDERVINVGMKNVVNHVVKFLVLWSMVGISKDMGINLRLIILSIVILKAWFTSFHVRNVERIMLEVPLHRLGKGLIITKVV